MSARYDSRTYEVVTTSDPDLTLAEATAIAVRWADEHGGRAVVRRCRRPRLRVALYGRPR